jgi:ATP-dependent DNA ligase
LSGMPSKRPLPPWIPPQLTQLVETTPSGSTWLHEIKLDGFRMQGRIERGQARLLTRTGLYWSAKYPSLLTALAAVRAKTAYLDGELCGVGDARKSRRHGRTRPPPGPLSATIGDVTT